MTQSWRISSAQGACLSRRRAALSTWQKPPTGISPNARSTPSQAKRRWKLWNQRESVLRAWSPDQPPIRCKQPVAGWLVSSNQGGARGHGNARNHSSRGGRGARGAAAQWWLGSGGRWAPYKRLQQKQPNKASEKRKELWTVVICSINGQSFL